MRNPEKEQELRDLIKELRAEAKTQEMFEATSALLRKAANKLEEYLPRQHPRYLKDDDTQ